MKKMKPGCYQSISELVVELNAMIPAEPKTINLYLDGFDIRFDYDSFSNKSIVTTFYGVLDYVSGIQRG